MNLTLPQVREAIVFLIALVLSITVHEYGHAVTADRLGDRTPRLQGRVTLNPLVHADPIGTFLLPLMAVLYNPSMLFGWGKPVQINPMSFTRKLRMKTSHLIVAAAGPAMNVALALLLTVVLGVLLASGLLKGQGELLSGIGLVIHLNWVLCFFNLIPVPPLDGGAVLAGVLPDRHHRLLDFLGQYGLFILIGLLVTGAVRFFLYPATWIYEFSMNILLRVVA